METLLHTGVKSTDKGEKQRTETKTGVVSLLERIQPEKDTDTLSQPRGNSHGAHILSQCAREKSQSMGNIQPRCKRKEKARGKL